MISKISIGPWGWFLLTVSTAVLAAACSEDAKGDIGDPCKTNSDCKAGLACNNNTCVNPPKLCTPECSKWIQTCFEGECVTVVDDVNDIDCDGWTRGSDPGMDCDDFDRTVHPEAYEYCDGVDNNCDGTIDEGCPYCKSGDAQTCGSDIGECTPGTQTCMSGIWQACSGQGPTPELCDRKDNDCDGLTDEGCPCHNGETSNCSEDKGICKRGEITCVEGKWLPDCLENGVAPVDEKCDGVDNDCDGLTDEGFNLNVPCTVTGECGEGVIECAGEWGMQCSTAPGGSQDGSGPELCNDLDDDCDGTTDEGCECTGSESRTCGSGEGECQIGNQTCQEGVWSECQGGVGPATELCNELDDDCDGETDEVFSNLGASCYIDSEDFGCGNGVYVCTSDGRGTICNSEPGSPTVPMFLTDDFENFVRCNGDLVPPPCWEVLDEAGTGPGPSNWLALNNEWWKDDNDVDDCDPSDENDCWLVETSNIFDTDSPRGTIAYWNSEEAMNLTDYSFRVDAFSIDNDGIGVVFRYQNPENFYRLLLTRDGFACNSLSGYLCRYLYVRREGTDHLIGTDLGYGYAREQLFQIEVKVSGEHIQVWKDGQTMFDVTDSRHQSGTVGLYSWGNHGANFDNVKVRAICP